MRAVRLIATGVLLGSVPLLGLASPSHAADETQISHVEPSGDNVRILVSVPEGASPDLDGVTVTIDGTDASATAETAEGASLKVERTAVLALDTSRSMAGDRFDAATAAAERFLELVPPDVRVGIVTFDHAVTTILEPTTDRAAARAAIDELTLALGTRLYDAVVAATELTGDTGQRQVLVLSDGANTGPATLESVIEALDGSDVRVDAVALDQSGPQARILQQITDAARGTVIPSDPESLTAAFEAEASELSRQVLVTAELPAAVTDTEATIAVTIPSADESLTASAYSRIRTSSAESAPLVAPKADDDRGLQVPQSALYAGLVALGLGLAILLGGLMSLITRDSGPTTVEDRINAFGAQAGPGPSSAAASGPSTLDSAKDAAASMLQRNRGLEAKIEARLDGAGSALKPAEWLLLHATIAMASGLVGFLLGGGMLLLLGLVLGTLVPWLWLGHKRKKRVAAFNSSLADTLQLISGSLSAGMSLAQSIDSVVNEGREPIAGEFKRVLIETRLGVPLEAALEGIALRIQSDDFAWVVMAIRIQREVGGNLAELLNTVAATLRERDYLRRQVKALSAEGRLSAYILIALPVGMFFYMLAFRGEYVGVLYQTGIGMVMLAAAGMLLGFGWFLMSRIVKVEI